MRKKFLWTLIFMLALYLPAMAAEISVTNGNADGDGSLAAALRQAVSRTNSVITISENVKNITLNTEQTISTNSSVTIRGNGAAISGSSASRIFRVTSGKVIFDRLTFTNGRAFSGGGGAVEIAGTEASAEFTNCTFYNNQAAETGGAVCVTLAGATTTLTQCTIVNNSATNGGGISALNGEVRLYSSIILGNSGTEDIYARDADNFTGSYNVTGKANFTQTSTNLSGQVLSDILTVNDDGTAKIERVNGAHVIRLSNTSPARDFVPKTSSHVLAVDEAGTSRPKLYAYDAGAFEAEPVPIESVEIFGARYVQKGKTEKFAVKVYPENALLNAVENPPDGIRWTSNSTSLTITDDGTAKAVSSGRVDLTARVFGWGFDGDEITRRATYTVYVGEAPASQITAIIDDIDDQVITMGSSITITPRVTLEIDGLELEDISGGYTLAASANDTEIITRTEIVSGDSVRIFAGNSAGETQVTIRATPESSETTRTSPLSFKVSVKAPSYAGGSSGGGCNFGIFGIAGIFTAFLVIKNRKD